MKSMFNFVKHCVSQIFNITFILHKMLNIQWKLTFQKMLWEMLPWIINFL